MTAKDVKEITYMPLVTFFSVLEWQGKTVRRVQQPPLVRRGLMLIWDSNMLNCWDLQLILGLQDWISIQSSTVSNMLIIHCTFYANWLCMSHPNSLNPCSIVGMTKNRRNSFNTFLFCFCFHATHISVKAWCFAVIQGDYKIHCCNYCIFWS